MDSIIKVIIGIVTVLMGSALLYVFKIRQLYLVIPRLFEYSTLSTNGKSVEIILMNKGRQTEEDVIMELDKNSKYELLASSSSQISINSNKIKTDRILPKSSVSILILAEGGNFNPNSISAFSSKYTNGKIINNMESVPSNHGETFIGILVLLIIFALMIFGFTKIPEFYTEYKVNKYSDEIRNQWNGLQYFVSTDFSDNYSTVEFPILLQSKNIVGDTLFLKYRVVNKMAAPFDVHVIFKGYHWWGIDKPEEYRRLVEEYHVLPYDFKDFTLRCFIPENDEKICSVEFSINTVNETIPSLIHKIQTK